MTKFLGRRGLAAVMGMILTSASAAPAAAQGASMTGMASLPALSFDLAAKVAASAIPGAQDAVTNAIQSFTGVGAGSPFATEAAWLYKGGWPLQALVDRYASNEQLDEQMNCLATAVYFEARGESVEGQLAVARVVMNRAASGKYPATWCATVKQPWQFSFVQRGQFPKVDLDSSAWRKSVAVAKLAAANIVPSLTDDVLWYHADYVAPAWGPRLTRVDKIGQHIFYRA